MKKKKFYIIITILFGCLCLLGCDTPSNDNLNDSNPKYKYTFEQYVDLTKFIVKINKNRYFSEIFSFYHWWKDINK